MIRKIKTPIFLILTISLISCLDEIEWSVNDEYGYSKTVKTNDSNIKPDSVLKEVDDIPTLLKESCVTVLTGEDSFGSGVFVKSNFIVTNYHVVFDRNSRTLHDNITVENQLGEIANAEVIKYDIQNDAAILKLNSSIAYKVLKLNTTTPKIGSNIWVAGNPNGLKGTISKGIVSNIQNTAQKFLIQHSAQITHGSSGGPVVNLSGELIGVSVSGFGEADLNFAVPSKFIERMLEDVN